MVRPSRAMLVMLKDWADRIAAMIAMSVCRSLAQPLLPLAIRRNRRPPALSVMPLLVER